MLHLVYNRGVLVYSTPDQLVQEGKIFFLYCPKSPRAAVRIKCANGCKRFSIGSRKGFTETSVIVLMSGKLKVFTNNIKIAFPLL